MNLLVLGGTGTINSEIVRQALDGDFHVTIFNRGHSNSPFQDRIRVLCGDRNNQSVFRSLMPHIDADVVIDMIAFRADDAQQTVETFGIRCRQLIFTSFIAAYDRPYHSFRIREDVEALQTSPDFSYGYEKAEMERYLNRVKGDVAAAITIIRPSLTFGTGSKNFGILRQNRNVARRIRQGNPLVMVGEGVIPWSFTFAPDLAARFLDTCGNEKNLRASVSCHQHRTGRLGGSVSRGWQGCWQSARVLLYPLPPPQRMEPCRLRTLKL